MRHLRDAEKLLGGYAAGILTEDEKTLLYSAALNNQELFNALADEEALRELLADPNTRQHLLSLLNHPAVKKPVRFWRRPALLGLAASLFAMVTTSVMLWQRERPTPSLDKEKTASQPTPAVPAPTESKQLTEKVDAKRLAPKKTPPSRPAPPEMAPVVQPSSQHTAESLADREQATKAENAPAPRAEMKKSHAAEAERVDNILAMDKSGTSVGAAFAKEEQKGFSTSRAKSTAAYGAVHAKSARTTPTSTEILERLENGKIRITVIWATENHLYVLKRTTTGPVLLIPIAKIQEGKGAARSIFEFVLNGQEHVDLYVLPQAVPDPNALTEEGVIDGYRKRVL